MRSPLTSKISRRRPCPIPRMRAKTSKWNIKERRVNGVENNSKAPKMGTRLAANVALMSTNISAGLITER